MNRAFSIFVIFFLFFFCVFVAPAALNDLSDSNAASISLSVDKSWIPTHESDDTTNLCTITVTLTNASANSNLTFQLKSTNWPGYCMNGAVNDVPDTDRNKSSNIGGK